MSGSQAYLFQKPVAAYLRKVRASLCFRFCCASFESPLWKITFAMPIGPWQSGTPKGSLMFIFCRVEQLRHAPFAILLTPAGHSVPMKFNQKQ